MPNTEEVTMIERKDLKIDKCNVREFNWFSDEELKDSVKRQGIIEPLIVRKDESDGKFGIVCGSRRFNAGLEAGMKLFPCIVRQMTDIEALAVSLQENKQRKGMDAAGIAENMQKIFVLLGNKSHAEKIDFLHKNFGFSKRTVPIFLKVGTLPKAFLDKYVREDGSKPILATKTAYGIATDSMWTEEEKMKAGEMLVAIKDGTEQYKVLSLMKKSGKDPGEAFGVATNKRSGDFLSVRLDKELTKPLQELCVKKHAKYMTIVNEVVKEHLKKEGMLE